MSITAEIKTSIFFIDNNPPYHLTLSMKAVLTPFIIPCNFTYCVTSDIGHPISRGPITISGNNHTHSSSLILLPHHLLLIDINNDIIL